MIVMKEMCVLDLDNKQAKAFFLQDESYSNIDLPQYFQFENLLKEVDNSVKGKPLFGFCATNPKEVDGVNHKLIANKDGCYAWRPLQLIHPVLYVDLVNCLTEESHWDELKKRFSEFQRNPKIECASIPIIANGSGRTQTAQQVTSWWKKVEQKSLEKAIDFTSVYLTDITDCYGSFYTHSIAWALMGREEAKANRKKNVLGNLIDAKIQNMSYGQTNGIPQGSVLMDFIAELILGYVDLILSEKIAQTGIDVYHIIRYRDDYRIFCNNSQDGELILKFLTEVLIDIGLKLNSAKTVFSNNLIEAVIKKDKFYWIEHEHKQIGNQKQLLLLLGLAKKYPNSGTLKTQLNLFFKALEIKPSDNIEVLISIITQIAYDNPSVYPVVAAILSKMLSKVESKDGQREIIEKIIRKLSKRPNTGFLQIWLQRFSYLIDKSWISYEEPLCQKVENKEVCIWNSDWISDKRLLEVLKKPKIVNRAVLSELAPEITQEEVDLFKFVYSEPIEVSAEME